MYAKLIRMVFGALLLTVGGTAMAAAQGPGRAMMMERLQAEGDEITIELLARSEAARLKAQEAFQAGDNATAQISRQEAHAYMFTAVKRTFPEMADRMGQGMRGCQADGSTGTCGMGQGMKGCQATGSAGSCGMGQGTKGCQANGSAGSCGMGQGCGAGRQGAGAMQGQGMGMGMGMGRGMNNGQGQGMMQGKCRAQGA